MFAILAITQIVFHAYNPGHKSTTDPTELDDMLVDIEVLDMSGSATAKASWKDGNDDPTESLGKTGTEKR